MRKQAGFTLIELMVVIAILGILATTAIPFYQTFRQRAYGAQAMGIMKGLVDGQILHNLQHTQFFPGVGDPDIFIPYEGEGAPGPPNAIEALEEALKVRLTPSKQFSYAINKRYGDERPGITIFIYSRFPLFTVQGSGGGYLMAMVYQDGKVEYYP